MNSKFDSNVGEKRASDLAFLAATEPWKDPGVQEARRLPISSIVYHFPSAASALSDAMGGPENRHGAWSELPRDSRWARSLNGTWKFALVDSPESALESGFEQPGFDDAHWASIEVPGAWAMQGFDRPHYTNVIMPFEADLPRPPAQNHVGLYRRTFTIPEDWRDGEYILRIGSAESFVVAWLDGTFVGYSKDSRLPAKFALEAEPGQEHVLALMVVQYSDASFVEDQDQWWLGGLHRSVLLLYRPAVAVQDVRIRAEIEAGDGNAHVEVRITSPEKTSEHALKTNNYALRIKLYDRNGSLIQEQEARCPSSYQAEGLMRTLHFRVKNVQLWSHENPALYYCTASIANLESNQEIDAVAQAFGFRTVKVEHGALLINGERVLIQGVNRHEFSETGGRSLTTKEMMTDIALLKRHHFNAVRCSHYPNDERWYELCDRYGIYLIDEANIEAHAYYDSLCRDPAWSEAFLARAQRMVLRDKNHPSIILWSLGNESGYGPNHELVAAWIRAYDPDRPLHYEGAVRPEWGQGPYSLETFARGASVTDIVCPMYPAIDLIEQWDVRGSGGRPLIMCEYSHAMGNSNGSLSDYWKAIRSGKNLQGGFIWEWADHGILDERSGGAHSQSPPGPNAAFAKPWRYGGDFGDSPSDLDFVCDGLLFPDRTLKPAMAECEYLFLPLEIVFEGKTEPARTSAASGMHPSGATFALQASIQKAQSVPLQPIPEEIPVVIRSRRYFEQLGPLVLKWKLQSANPDAPDPIAEGSLEIGSIAAKAAKRVVIRLGELKADNDTSESPQSGLPAPILDEITPKASALWSVDAQEFSLTILIEGSDPFFKLFPLIYAKEAFVFACAPHAAAESRNSLRAHFSEQGFLYGLQISPTQGLAFSFLQRPLEPVLFRAPTQNDGLKNFIPLRGKPEFAFYYQNKAMYPWLDAGLDELHTEIIYSENTGTEWRWHHRILTSNGIECGQLWQEWNFEDPAALVLHVRFLLNDIVPEYARIGLKTRLAPGLARIEWFGHGPHENYPDRQSGALIGRYHVRPKELIVPYIVPQENGARGGVRFVALQFARPPARTDFSEQAGLHEGAEPSDNARPRKSEASVQLVIEGGAPFSFTISPYAEQELWRARHFDELPPLDEAFAAGAWLYIDLKQRGVGTATCGPDTLGQYRLFPGEYSNEFRFSARLL
ncbi:MAG: glycoside hydrolase family 2 TIM barrel-domain containing protein [Rectinema subterraneum]|uniref:glycoside hydrolase family 2 TIM barrel-domain containing protein n=1 Tax=Rectinema subterraneum TaxID=2653714 RepID=UPI003C7C3196